MRMSDYRLYEFKDSMLIKILKNNSQLMISVIKKSICIE